MANAQYPQGCKSPWGPWGVALRLKEQKGSRRSLHPWSQRQGTSLGRTAGFLGSSGLGKCPPLLSCSSGLGGSLPPTSPDLPSLLPITTRTHVARKQFGGAGDWPGISTGSLCLSGRGNHPPLLSCSSWMAPPTWLSWSLRPSSFVPRTHTAWMGLWKGVTSLGAQQVPQPEWARRSPSIPLPLFLESPSHLPLLISLASGVLILSGLHFSSPLSPPTSYQFTSGFFPSPWASESPPAACRRSTCGETLTPCLPTPPSWLCLLFCILTMCVFTGVALLISFKNFFAFTTWLTTWCKRHSFWSI